MSAARQHFRLTHDEHPVVWLQLLAVARSLLCDYNETRTGEGPHAAHFLAAAADAGKRIFEKDI
jgi:hypothetical protein